MLAFLSPTSKDALAHRAVSHRARSCGKRWRFYSESYNPQSLMRLLIYHSILLLRLLVIFYPLADILSAAPLDVARYAFDRTIKHLNDHQNKICIGSNDRFGVREKEKTGKCLLYRRHIFQLSVLGRNIPRRQDGG